MPWGTGDESTWSPEPWKTAELKGRLTMSCSADGYFHKLFRPIQFLYWRTYYRHKANKMFKTGKTRIF
jgi:hypothetical protein